MSVLVSHLRKEWREQKSFLLVLSACIPVLLGSCALGFPTAWGTYDNVVFLAAYGCCALCALVLGGRLVADEIRSGGIRFLDRLPHGLWPSFAAKALLLLLGLLIATLIGLVSGGAIRSLAFGDHQHWSYLLRGPYWLPLLLFIGPAFGLMSVSAWMPRSGVALPGLFVLFLLLAAPVWVVYWLLPELSFTHPVFLTAITHLTVGSLVAAAVSYVRGWRRSGREQRSLGLGVLVLVLFMLPVWGSAGLKAWSVLRPDPTSPLTSLYGGFLGADGRTLYINFFRKPDQDEDHGALPSTLRIDLRDGSWERDGGRGSVYENVGALDRSAGVTGDIGHPDYIARKIYGVPGHDLVDTRSGLTRGRIVNDVQGRAWIEQLRAVKRATTPWRLWDQRRVWVLNGSLEVEDGDGWAPHMQLGSQRVAQGPRGPVLVQGDGGHLIDLNRGMVVPRGSFDPPRIAAMLRAGWLVRLSDSALLQARREEAGQAAGGTPQRWHIEDPGSGKLRPTLGLEPDDTVRATLDATQVLVISGRHQDGDARELFVVDPARGTRRPVSCPGTRLQQILEAGEMAVPARTPAGKRLFLIKQEEGYRLARLDQDPWRLVLTVPTVEPVPGWPIILLACPDEDHALVIAQHRRIERWTFGTQQREVLFPRP